MFVVIVTNEAHGIKVGMAAAPPPTYGKNGATSSKTGPAVSGAAPGSGGTGGGGCCSG
jgi:hypothetical protein